MSDQTIFGDNSNPGSNPANPQGGASTPPNVPDNQAVLTLLSEIKNERGEPKYKSLPDALNALKHSQEYIPTLTSQLSQKDSELAAARAEAARVAELERSIQELTQRGTNPPNTPSPGMTPEQIADLVKRNLEAAKAEDIAKQNTALVASSLQSSLGADAEAKYNAKASEMGMSVAEFNALAARSPKAVLAMFGVQAAQRSAAPNTSSVNTTGLTPPQETFIGRNKETVAIGATTEDMMKEFHHSVRMAEELAAQGKSVHDLSNPKEFFKFFGKH